MQTPKTFARQKAAYDWGYSDDDGGGTPPSRAVGGGRGGRGVGSAVEESHHHQQGRSSRHDGSAHATHYHGETSRSKLGPVTASSANCTRLTVVCIVALCLLWPGLLIAGGILAATANPQQAQRDEFAAAAVSFTSQTADVLLTTSALTVTEVAPRTLTPAYQLLTETPFPESRTLVLRTEDRHVVPETLGPNLGSVTVRITYRQGADSSIGQTYTFVSPPITLTRPARRLAYCTPPYARICGTTTCCTSTEMQRQCVEIVRGFSTSSPADFVPNGDDCRLGLLCGHCAYRQTVSDLCFVIRWSALTGWSGDETLASCDYPFLPAGQGYADSDRGATLTLRAVDDPYLVLQRMTEGSMSLADDNGDTRSQGRGLILFGVLVLLLAVCVALLAKFCGSDVLTSDAVRRAFGIKVRPKPASGDGGRSDTWREMSRQGKPTGKKHNDSTVDTPAPTNTRNERQQRYNDRTDMAPSPGASRPHMEAPFGSPFGSSHHHAPQPRPPGPADDPQYSSYRIDSYSPEQNTAIPIAYLNSGGGAGGGGRRGSYAPPSPYERGGGYPSPSPPSRSAHRRWAAHELEDDDL